MNQYDELYQIMVELDKPTQVIGSSLRVELCRKALRLIEFSELPKLWASLQVELGNNLSETQIGNKATNLEEAIECYKEALKVRDRDTMPTEWATAINNLAVAYSDRICGDRAANLEQAIDYYQQALKIRTHDAIPIEWAESISNLATSYMERIRGDKADNIECAIVLCQQALQVRQQDTILIEWVTTTMNLANAYSLRIRGERGQNIEQAISHYKQILQLITKDTLPLEWATTMMNLATAYRYRVSGDRVENLERAIDAYRQSLTVKTRDAMPVDWAIVMNNLGGTYADRIRGQRGENLERAIECYEQALQLRKPDVMPVEWAMTMNNLAAAYTHRIYGNHAENLELAIKYYQQALQIRTYENHPLEWATTMMNLGNAYRNRILGSWDANLEKAINCYEQSLRVRTQQASPILWAEVLDNLALAHSKFSYGSQGEHIQQSIELYNQVLQVRRQDVLPAEHRQTQSNLGSLYLKNECWQPATAAFQSAMEAGNRLYEIAATPESRQAELREMSSIPTRLAYSLSRQSTECSDYLIQAVVTLERNRARWLAESLALRSEIPANVPVSVWQQFTVKAAQIQQLQSQARLPDATPGKHAFLTLSSLLAAARHELNEIIAQVRSYNPDFMPTPSLAEIQSIFAAATSARGQPEVGVYLLATQSGGLALLVHAGNVTPVWLDELSDETLTTLLRDWFTAYSEFLGQRTDSARQAWFAQMETITQRLWDIVIGPIAATIDKLELALGPARQPPLVTLIPSGLLALLPLHAAWRAMPLSPPPNLPQVGGGTDSSSMNERRYFLDDYAVRYAPSATALRHCRERATSTAGNHLLAIDEPQPITRGSPLPNSAREVTAIASLFATAQVSRHTQATHTLVRDSLPTAQIAHFSCHGANNWQNPLDSGLLLANDELLTVRDFLELHLPTARLATLSACETGIVGTDLPDEVIMLPSALVQAGYAGVVASLWSVADVSTAMLMVRFYQFWQQDGLEPIYALRAAQRWLRDTTNQEKADYFGQFVFSANPQMADTVAADFFSAIMLSADGLEARSFAHPFWWGAFYLTGV